MVSKCPFQGSGALIETPKQRRLKIKAGIPVTGLKGYHEDGHVWPHERGDESHKGAVAGAARLRAAADGGECDPGGGAGAAAARAVGGVADAGGTRSGDAGAHRRGGGEGAARGADALSAQPG